MCSTAETRNKAHGRHDTRRTADMTQDATCTPLTYRGIKARVAGCQESLNRARTFLRLPPVAHCTHTHQDGEHQGWLGGLACSKARSKPVSPPRHAPHATLRIMPILHLCPCAPGAARDSNTCVDRNRPAAGRLRGQPFKLQLGSSMRWSR